MDCLRVLVYEGETHDMHCLWVLVCDCRTDVCMVVVRKDNVMLALDAAKRLTSEDNIQAALEDYEAYEPGVSRVIDQQMIELKLRFCFSLDKPSFAVMSSRNNSSCFYCSSILI